jgi:hypothetical protein
VITLSLDSVLELLGAPTIAGEQRQMERLRKWVEGLVKAHGEDYVRQNKRDLLAQWEQHVKGAFSSCL